jgi:hypothetical protein
MGTRSTIHVKEGKKTLLSMYIQYDGYLEGVGGQLYEFLAGRNVVNGYTLDNTRDFNGERCLAAQLVAYFKKGIGGHYITDSKDRQEYNYFIEIDNQQIKLRVTDWGNKKIFHGDLENFLVLLKQEGYTPKTTLDHQLLFGGKQHASTI